MINMNAQKPEMPHEQWKKFMSEMPDRIGKALQLCWMMHPELREQIVKEFYDESTT